MTNLETRVEAFEFLDNLRESGVVNMFGARPILADALELDQAEATELLSTWMRTFDEDVPAATRAAT